MIVIPEEIEQQINVAVAAFLEGSAVTDFDPALIKLDFKVKGKAWHGVVDKAVAQFLLDLDLVVTRKFEEFGINLEPTKHGVISLRIEEGSLEVFFQYGEKILKQIRQMSTKDKLLASAILLTIFGFPAASDIVEKITAPIAESIEAERDIEMEKIRSEERERMIDRLARVTESALELQKPVRGLVAKMESGDTIILPGRVDEMDRHEAKKTLDKYKRQKPKTYYIDQVYIIEELLTKNSEKWYLSLRYGDVSFRAEIQLSEEELQKLLEGYESAHKINDPITAGLHVTAEINAKGVKTALVVGVGSPRVDNKGLSAALIEQRDTDQATAKTSE